MSTGSVCGIPNVLLRIEGVVLLGTGVLAYGRLGHSWWLFGALILGPDVSMFAYLANARVGAAAYNAAHTISAVALLGGLGLVFQSSLALAVASIWLAHIGLDRALGYGLKYGTRFADTHLGELGARSSDGWRLPWRRA